MQIAIIILSVLTGLYGAYYLIIAALGAFRPARKHPEAPPQFKLAALIAARNEEAVIADLVKSLMEQRYPRELFDVIVVVNNCDDDTAGAAEAAGARVLPCTVPVRSKGEVLKFAFDELLSEDYDAFVIFDADNLVDPNYFQVVGDALQSGLRVAQGYRDSKNADANWIAGGVSIFYWGMSRLYNRARDTIGMSAALNGTGFMIAASLLREIDYNFTTLTEDLELTAKCALHGEKLGWMQDAVSYDEEPVRFGQSFTQRRRWFAGTFQCLKKFGLALLKNAIRKKSLASFDMFTVFFGTLIQLVCFLPPVLLAIFYVLAALRDPARWVEFLEVVLAGIAIGAVSTAGIALFICLLEKKLTRGRIGALVGFPIFMLTWMLANLTCLFTKPPRWKQIRHGENAELARKGNLPM